VGAYDGADFGDAGPLQNGNDALFFWQHGSVNEVLEGVAAVSLVDPLRPSGGKQEYVGPLIRDHHHAGPGDTQPEQGEWCARVRVLDDTPNFYCAAVDVYRDGGGLAVDGGC
jgi:hypothetical protein